MIDTQEKLNKVMEEAIKEANEKSKTFKLFDSNVNVDGLPSLTRCRDFKVDDLHDDFLNCYCDIESPLVGEALYYYILSLYSIKNKIKTIDYLSSNDIEKIKELNPKYCFGKFSEDDYLEELPEEITRIEELYEPNPLDENKDYVVLIKDENSASIAFKFLSHFNVSFLHLASSVKDVERNLFFLDDKSIESGKDENELIQIINTRYCRLYISFCYASCVNESDVLVYKVNRSTRKKKKSSGAIPITIVK